MSATAGDFESAAGRPGPVAVTDAAAPGRSAEAAADVRAAAAGAADPVGAAAAGSAATAQAAARAEPRRCRSRRATAARTADRTAAAPDPRTRECCRARIPLDRMTGNTVP